MIVTRVVAASTIAAALLVASPGLSLNNGDIADPAARRYTRGAYGPFAKLLVTESSGARKACSATLAKLGKTKATRVLTAGHCFFAAIQERVDAARDDDSRKRLQEALRSRRFQAKQLVALVAYLSGAYDKSEVIAASFGVTVDDAIWLREQVGALRDALAGREGYDALAVELRTSEGERHELPIQAVDVHPLFLASAVIGGSEVAPYDLAVLSVTLPAGNEGLALADQFPDPARSSIFVTGFGYQFEPLFLAGADSDQDGVSSHEDLCPFSPAGAAVDERGCTDGDPLRLTMRFRMGRAPQTTLYQPYPADGLLKMGQPTELILSIASLERAPAEWLHSPRETLPGKADSGAALVLESNGDLKILGVYSGPGKLAGPSRSVGFFQSMANPVSRYWLTK